MIRNGPPANPYSTAPSPPAHHFTHWLPDSAATGTLIAAHQNILHHLEPTNNTTGNSHANLPDGTHMKITHKGLLAIPGIGPIQTYVAPNLQTGPILAIPQLADAGCTTVFAPTAVTVTAPDGTVVLRGPRDRNTGMWTIPTATAVVPLSQLTTPERFPPPPGLHLNATTTRSVLATERARWGHRTMGSPSPSTLLDSMSKHGSPLPAFLNPTTYRDNLTNELATSYGHLDQTRQGQRPSRRCKKRTTQPTSPAPALAGDSNADADHVEHTAANIVDSEDDPEGAARLCIIMCAADGGALHGDPMGKFPVESATGNNYILALRVQGRNFIMLTPFRTRHGSDIAGAYKTALRRLAARGITNFTKLVMDNETSPELRAIIQAADIPAEYVPPSTHRRNIAERDIRTAKNHIIATLSATDPNFPFAAWDELIPQSELTLNLLRTSARDPTKTAWADVFGPFDPDRTPIGPPGCLVVALNPADGRESFAPHGVVAFYVGPAFNHYRCYTVFVPSTNRTRIVDTLTWHPVGIRVAGPSIEADFTTFLRDAAATGTAISPDLLAAIISTAQQPATAPQLTCKQSRRRKRGWPRPRQYNRRRRKRGCQHGKRGCLRRKRGCSHTFNLHPLQPRNLCPGHRLAEPTSLLPRTTPAREPRKRPRKQNPPQPQPRPPATQTAPPSSSWNASLTPKSQET